jgi:hypothetical protein
LSCSSSFISVSCTHRPIHDQKYCEWVINQVDKIKPKVFVHCGDLFDNDCIGKFAKGGGNLKEEYDDANDFLGELNDKLGKAKRVFIQGNHENRIFRQEQKHISELIDFRKHVPELKSWQIIQYKQHPNNIYRLGQVSFYHGFGTTKRAVVCEAINLSGPNTLMIGGHLHRGHDPVQITWGENLKLPYWYANCGCGISSKVDYFQTHDTSNWNRGMIVGECDLKKTDKPNWSAEFVLHSRIWDV